MCPASATALKEEACSAIVDEGDEQRKFDRLQQRAGRAGHTLLRVPGGYMLLRLSASHHSSSLDAISLVLSARERAE